MYPYHPTNHDIPQDKPILMTNVVDDAQTKDGESVAISILKALESRAVALVCKYEMVLGYCSSGFLCMEAGGKDILVKEDTVPNFNTKQTTDKVKIVDTFSL